MAIYLQLFHFDTEAMFLLYMDTIDEFKWQLPKTNRWKTKQSANLDNFWCNCNIRTLPEKWLVSSLELENLICKVIILKRSFIGILKSSEIFQNKHENSTPTLIFAIAWELSVLFRVLKLTKLTNFLSEPACYIYRVMYNVFFFLILKFIDKYSTIYNINKQRMTLQN